AQQETSAIHLEGVRDERSKRFCATGPYPVIQPAVLVGRGTCCLGSAGPLADASSPAPAARRTQRRDAQGHRSQPRRRRGGSEQAVLGRSTASPLKTICLANVFATCQGRCRSAAQLPRISLRSRKRLG